MQFLIDTVLVIIYIAIFLYLCAVAWKLWKLYINQKFLNKINSEMIMLEIKLPRDIFKSPYAMETAMSSLIQGGGVGSWWHRNVLGNLPVYFSVEIASLEGVIHFYIRLQKKFRELVEANLYAQYPGIEITQADDYTQLIRYHHLSNDVEMWGSSYPLRKKWTPLDEKGKEYKFKGKSVELKADFTPLKTYVDYGLDRDPKEEFKIDPITPLLEFMGSVGKGEYVWYQILVQDEGAYDGKKFPKTYLNPATGERYTLAEMADMRKKQIRKVKKVGKGDLAYDLYGNPIQRTLRGPDGQVELKEVTYGEEKEIAVRDTELKMEEKEEIEAINHKLAKPLVRGIIRLLYVAKKEAFNGGHIQNILSIMRSFNDVSSVKNMLGLKVVDPYEYPWQNRFGRRVPWRKEEKFEAFVEREGFYPHIPERKNLDETEDMFFWGWSMKSRKIFRMMYEIILHPFAHEDNDEICTLNLEELATLYHFPGQVATTPTLPRIDSTKGVAPVNLPQ